MPKPVFPDRPIWPPLPSDTDRQPEGPAESCERVLADAAAPDRSGEGNVIGMASDRATPTQAAILA
ncbi:hypothetical protein DK427_22200 [Methylobacterium radiodurans]|uniref:Uncharacterized protein n=1 Tax=Methylobacterium radiodurans TaxID=2202828 RepID=A0A2U8VWB9_9HYPH|nr:hypothetical protein DK427_22200 [Methylobacterium radiodurans]